MPMGVDTLIVILAVVDLVEEIHPGFNSDGDSIELDSVNKGRWGGVDTLAGSVLPHGAKGLISAVGVLAFVDPVKIGLVHAELNGNLMDPVSDKFSLGEMILTQDSGLHVEGVVLVLVAVAVATNIAQGHEEGNHLGDLVRVLVEGKRVRSRGDSDVVSNGSIEPLSGENCLPDRVEGLAVTAEVVLKELNLDVSLATTQDPAGVGSEDGG